MKKFYSLTLSMLACSMSMSAATFTKADVTSFDNSNKLCKSIISEKSISNESKLTPKANAGEANPTIDEIVGEYIWSFYSYLNSSSGSKRGIMELSKGEEDNSLLLDLAGWPVNATYDETTGVISVESGQFIEYNEYNGIDVYFYHNRWNDDGHGNNFLTTPLEITVAGNELHVEDLDNIVIGLQNVGYFIFAGSNSFQKVEPPVDMETGWTQVGTGTFYDGWILSGMGMTLEDVAAGGYVVNNVILEKNEDGIYRLNNPYQVSGSVFLDYELNVSEIPGYVVFDARDPEFVTVLPAIYSGMTDLDMNGDATDYYMSNLEAYFTKTAGYSKEQVINSYDEISNLDSNTGTVMFYNCCFGIQGEETTPYRWNNQVMTGMFVSEALKGTGSGVEGVEASSENAPKEYFNLQGQRVANPEKGLYIVRQGEKSSKVLVK